MRILIMLLLSAFMSTAAVAAEFTAGKQYEVIANITNPPAGKTVTEFFSYGCPACYQFEPTIEAWLAKKPKDVQFDRVPVVFNPAWEAYAKAYYTAQSLGVLNKTNLALFKVVHEEGRDLTADGAMADFFAERGVSKKDFSNVYDFAPGMAPRLHKANVLLTTYGVTNVPTVVVNGKYRISRAMVRSDQEFIQVINFLLSK